ncbi:MAG: PepSY domain-containing protein [Neomegalonema sp.]|nr:PepSY domain-containing protein [Neomegalonema sp.]
MAVRPIVFWAHLVVGCVVAVFVLLMSATGVLLTYERQILAYIERGRDSASTEKRLSADELAVAARKAAPKARALVFANRPGAPIGVQVGRHDLVYLDRTSGEKIGDNHSGAAAFFEFVTHLHRWLALEGANRNVARMITGASNLAFLFLIVSGLYLWLPKRWRSIDLRTRLLFRTGHPNGKARDYNWHHVFGFWMLIPLFFVVSTAAVFSYPWANALVYKAYGETPVRGRGPGAKVDAKALAALPAVTTPAPQPLEAVLTDARKLDPAWRTIAIALPRPSATTTTARIDPTIGGQPHRATTISYRLADAKRIGVSDFSALSPGRQARIVIRFLHTGEVLGFWGQTVAGLASLAACFLVWTGIALAWRRLVSPRLRRAS